MTLRVAAISASAAGDSATAAPFRATATTSAKLTGPAPTMTVFMLTMVGPGRARPAPARRPAPQARRRLSHCGLNLAAVHRDQPAEDPAAADPQAVVLP